MPKPALLSAAFLLMLAGCGAKPAAVVPVAEGADTIVADATPSPAGRDGLTAIDAAIGDGAAMPADSDAPSAYDLAVRAHAQLAAAPPRATPDAAATLAVAPVDLLRYDESVATGG